MHIFLERMTRTAGTLAIILLVSACCEWPKPPVVLMKPPPEPEPEVSELEQKLEAFDARLAAKREELMIPGLSLVIVKDDKIVYLKGHGLRNIAENLPVTEDTLFAIGSTTKAFTATLAMMAVEEGKLSLDDSPKKYLPYFSLKDKEADEKITVRDLFTHTSGIKRTDLGWVTGKLTKEEVIKLVGLAEPVCKLGEEFNYQNVMYLAAGECVASAMNKSYADLIQERIFDPVGMPSTNVSVAKTLKLPERAVGYSEDYQTKMINPVTMRPLDNIAPAGAINASAKDMGRWLRFNLGRGQIDNKRLLKEESFDQMFNSYYSFADAGGYGLGWMIGTWNDIKEFSHSGGIDGFITQVSFLPEENVGFALFTNIEKSEIQGWVTNEVFSLFTDKGKAEATVAILPEGAEKEVGTYGVLGGVRVGVQLTNGKLTLQYPDSPKYTLEPVQDRRYRFGPPAPPGLYVTFRPSEKYEGEDEIFTERPWGNVILRRLTPEMIDEAKNKEPPKELVEFIGTYGEKDRPIEYKIAALEGRVVLAPPGDWTFPLIPTEVKDEFSLDGVSPGLTIKMHRDAEGKVVAATYTMFDNKTELTRIAEVDVPNITKVKLLEKVAKAHGSKQLDKLKTLVFHYAVDFVNEGPKGTMTLYRQAPNKYADETTFTAFGKDIGKWRSTFDGNGGFSAGDFVPVQKLTDTELDGHRYHGIFNPFKDWDNIYDTVGPVTTSKIGDEVVYVVEKQRKGGMVIVDYYSAKTFLLLKKQTRIKMRPDWPPNVSTEVYSDYRKVGKIMVPHRIELDNFSGKTVFVVEKVEPNAEIPEDIYKMPPWAGY